VFSYSLLDALEHATPDRNGFIEVTALASFVDAAVPEISQKAFHVRQVPQMKLVGSDFPLVRPTAVLGPASAAPVISRKPTHVTIRTSEVFAQPATGAATQKLEPGTLVTLVQTAQGWVLVAKDGNAVGYVAAVDLIPVQ
jgi:hypothetical protein